MAGVPEYVREEIRERLRTDTPYWAEHCAKIIDKRRELVPLVPHPWQLELDAKLEAQRDAGLPMRAIILKARQLGFSTWVQAKITQRVTQWENQRAVVVAHDVKTAGAIFTMAATIHAHLPTMEMLGLGFSIKPYLVGRSFTENGRKFLAFSNERSRLMREQGRGWESVLDIDTANAPEAGRGQTRSLVHLSEVAKWPDNATSGTTSKMVSVLNSVPYLPETLVVLESTANGLNHFHKRWISARDGQGDPSTGETYVTVFVPWWRDPMNAIQFATPERREEFVESIGTGPYGEDEPALVELYECSPEQLLWRRMQIRTQHEDNVQLFKQENPASDEEAFIGSGRTVFSGILVGRAIKAAEQAPAPVRGTLRASGFRERHTRSGTILVPTGALWVPEADMARSEPALDVWEHPVTEEAQMGLPAPERRPEGAYVVAADIAEGAANTFTEGDFHAVQVFDHRTREQVAVHESRMDIHDVPMWLLLIALYYNRARLAVEVNGPGIAVTEPLSKDYRYSRLFRRQRIDTTRNVTEDKAGWKTDRVSKPILEAGFGMALKEDTHGLRDPRTARQLNTYVIDDRGRHGAQQGEHDDLLMAAMIAHRIMDVLRPPRDGKRKRPRRYVEDDLTGY